jgi:hypothetical protein
MPSSVPQSLTTSPPSPSPSSTPLPEEDLGLCGLTDAQWHIVLILGVCCEYGCANVFRTHAPLVLMRITSTSTSLHSFDRLPRYCRHSVDKFGWGLLRMAPGTAARRDDQDGYVSFLSTTPSGTPIEPESYLPPHSPPRINRPLDLREKLFGHMLSGNDVRILTPGAAITPRRYPIVDFVLAPQIPPMQRGSG